MLPRGGVPRRGLLADGTSVPLSLVLQAYKRTPLKKCLRSSVIFRPPSVASFALRSLGVGLRLCKCKAYTRSQCNCELCVKCYAFRGLDFCQILLSLIVAEKGGKDEEKMENFKLFYTNMNTGEGVYIKFNTDLALETTILALTLLEKAEPDDFVAVDIICDIWEQRIEANSFEELYTLLPY